MSRSPAPLEGPTVPQRPLSPIGDGEWIDRVIAGKYAVEGILGRGGMGLVLKARHLRLDEPVAIKVLHRSLLHDPTMGARMLREARAALRLSSEHVVRVMDVDTLENGVPFMVLEYLEGTDVASLAKSRESPMPWEHVVAILEQACRALAEAHAIGIVHRDLKPANLFIVKRPDGRRVVKLLDFGVSKLDLPREAPITKQGDILGSPRYMSPEQVKGDALDGRSDIWSVGVVLYELLTGTPPFGGPNFAVACRRVLEETPVPLLTLRPDVPPGLAAVVNRCLEKDRDRRFPDVLALRDALAPFGVLAQRTGSQLTLPDIGELLSSDVPVSPVGAATSESIVPPPPEDPSNTSLTADVRPSHTATAIGARVRSRRFRWMALAGLLVGLIIGITLLVRGREPEASRSSAPDRPKESAPASSAPPAASATSAAIMAAPSPTPPAMPSSSASASPSASASAEAKGAWKPASRAGPGGTSTARPAASNVDPFGERRQ